MSAGAATKAKRSSSRTTCSKSVLLMRALVTTASTFPSRTWRSRSGLSPKRRCSNRSGRRLASRGRSGTSQERPTSKRVPSVSSKGGAAASSRASDEQRAALSKSCRACGNKRDPAAVSVTRRALRWKSAVPSCSSSRRMRSLKAGGERRTSRAAAANPRRRAAASKQRRDSRSGSMIRIFRTLVFQTYDAAE